MEQETQTELLEAYLNCWTPPFTGSLEQWANKYIHLDDGPIKGSVSFDETPWLRAPAESLLDKTCRMVLLIGGVQTGKSFLTEIWVPYLVANDPAKLLRMHLNADLAKEFTTNRLLPIMEQCSIIKPMLEVQRFQKRADSITLPNRMHIKAISPTENYLHGITAKYLILDETHEYAAGVLEKIIARTNAYAQTRKIVVSSMPNEAGSELEKYYDMSQIHQWQWCCPSCSFVQPYYWSKEREDHNSFAGFNWDKAIDENGNTNIALTAKTCWLECIHCKNQLHDNVSTRRLLNDSSRYVLIKQGNPEMRSYTWPQFINRGLSFEYFASQFLNAKRMFRNTGLRDDLITFTNQVLGDFYRREKEAEQSQLAIADYLSTDKMPGETRIMTVDYQRTGLAKYWLIWAYNKEGTESHLVSLGICRTWKEIKDIQKKWEVMTPYVGIDSGDGETTAEVYAESIKNGESLKDKDGRIRAWLQWSCLKGDGSERSFKHKDGKHRLYSEVFYGDPLFAMDSKYKGLFANVYRLASNSIKSILLDLRDNKIKGVKWLVNVRDPEFEKQLFSEVRVTKINKKTGLKEEVIEQIANANHYFDCAYYNLGMAIMLGAFSFGTDVKENK